MWLATGAFGAYLSKYFSKKVLEIVLDTEILAPPTVSVFGKTKRRKPLILLGFQRFLSSDIFDYFAVMSEISKSLENRLPSRAREFESHTLRHLPWNSHEFQGFFFVYCVSIFEFLRCERKSVLDK